MKNETVQPEERKRLLRQRLAANAQRNGRREYLKTLPQDLSSYLAEREFFLPPEHDAIAPLFWIGPSGIGQPPFQPEGFQYHEFSWPEQILAAAVAVGSTHDQDAAYFWPLEDNPIYLVEFGWVRQNLNELFSYVRRGFVSGFGPVVYSPEHLGVITTDRRAGMVISHYCGYLQEDPNPDEIVLRTGNVGIRRACRWNRRLSTLTTRCTGRECSPCRVI